MQRTGDSLCLLPVTHHVLPIYRSVTICAAVPDLRWTGLPVAQGTGSRRGREAGAVGFVALRKTIRDGHHYRRCHGGATKWQGRSAAGLNSRFDFVGTDQPARRRVGSPGIRCSGGFGGSGAIDRNASVPERSKQTSQRSGVGGSLGCKLSPWGDIPRRLNLSPVGDTPSDVARWRVRIVCRVRDSVAT